MANAQTLTKEPAPLKKAGNKFQLEDDYLDRVMNPDNNYYDPAKKYVYELAWHHMERDKPIMDARSNRPAPVQEFKPYQNIVYTSQIIWKGQRRVLRYYDGCTTPFADEQSKDKESIDMFIAQTLPRNFENGKFMENGDNKWLLFYLDVCSWNSHSPFRTRSATHVFINADSATKINAKISKIDQLEEAMRLAREASDVKMRIHSSYLGLSYTDYDSGNALTEKELRTQYRDEAVSNPSQFIESYGNKSIEVKYYINKALADGTISNNHNPNKATWGSNHTEIIDISGLKSHDAIGDKLYEYSQTEAGEEFLIQLKALYSN